MSIPSAPTCINYTIGYIELYFLSLVVKQKFLELPNTIKNKVGKDQNFPYTETLEGSGKFFIENEKFTVEKGDLVFIPKGIKYKDSGQLTLLSVSVPKFDIKEWVTIEDAK